MHDGSDYGQGLAKVVQDEFIKLGGTVVSFTAITPGESDYSAALADVAAKNPQALYYAGYAAESSVIANQKKNAGLGNAILFSDDGTYGKDFLTRTGANGEGTYSTSPVPPETPEVKKFNDAYTAKYGVAPGVLSPYSWTAYDSAAVLIHDIESVAVKGGDGNLYIPRSALVTAVRNTKDYKGLAGTVTCGSDGECSSTGPTFYIDKSNAWVPAGQ
jgi:branched-chain amino acid transport system substrate-binding protein